MNRPLFDEKTLYQYTDGGIERHVLGSNLNNTELFTTNKINAIKETLKPVFGGRTITFKPGKPIDLYSITIGDKIISLKTNQLYRIKAIPWGEEPHLLFFHDVNFEGHGRKDLFWKKDLYTDNLTVLATGAITSIEGPLTPTEKVGGRRRLRKSKKNRKNRRSRRRTSRR